VNQIAAYVNSFWNEITLNLARCYLYLKAEKKKFRTNDIGPRTAYRAKFPDRLRGTDKNLVVRAGLSIQKNYMYATIAHLEGNQEN